MMLCIALTIVPGIPRFGFRLYKPNEIIVINVISWWKSGSILSMYENIWNQKAFARGHPKTECSGLNGSSMNASWQNLQAAYGFLLIGIWLRWRSFQKEVRVILSILLWYSNWKYSFHLNLFDELDYWIMSIFMFLLFIYHLKILFFFKYFENSRLHYFQFFFLKSLIIHYAFH